MKLRPNQLKEHFSKHSPLPVYIISGDEPLLMQETTDHIRAGLRNSGFTERERMDVEPGFDWNQLLDAGQNLSLFGDRKIIEVRLNKAKFEDKAKKTLTHYCQHTSPDNTLVLITPKLDRKTVSAKWFQPILSLAAFIAVWPIEASQMPGWVHQRMQRAGLEPNREAVELFIERTEGNLLAADQEIQKLVLLQGPGPLSVEDIEHAVHDHARYTLYSMVDQALQGHFQQALKMLHQLKASGAEPTLVLWLFSRELRSLASMAQQLHQGLSMNKVFQDNRIWDNRKKILESALNRLSPSVFKQCLLEASRIDRSIKGLLPANPWDGFANLILWLSGSVTAGKLSIIPDAKTR